MSAYSGIISKYEMQLNEQESIKLKIDALADKVSDMSKHCAIMLEAQQLLSAVSEQSTNNTLDFIVGVINKTLGEMFPFDRRTVYLEKYLHADKHPHIKVRMITADGVARDLQLQSGTGLRQVVSFLFLVCLIELRKCRRLLLMDEILSGMHDRAKLVVQDIMSIFAESGFQFVFIEHSGMESFGKRYLFEKSGKTSTVTPLDDGFSYSKEVFIFNKPEGVDWDIVKKSGDLPQEEVSEDDSSLYISGVSTGVGLRSF